jgi:hypothetical protein
MAILTGGVYAYGSLGGEGLTRESVPAAFDSNGYLKPSAVAKMRPLIPDGVVYDFPSQETSARQVVEWWIYEDTGFTNVDAALARLYVLFQGHQFNDAFPCEWVGTPIVRGRDEGALTGRSMARQDWLIVDIQGD